MAASPTSVRVLVVLHEVDVGGATRAVLQPIPYLEELGWDFVFWAPTGGSVEATLRDSGRVMDGVPRLLRYRWPALREPPGPRARALAVLPYMTRYRRWLARVAPGLVHANTLVSLPEAAVARSARRRVVLHAHEMLPLDVTGAFAGRLARVAANAVVVPSEAAAAPLRHLGVRVRVVPYGVPPSAAGPADRRPPGERPVVGTLATVSSRKGSDVFVDAAHRVRTLVPAADFRMVGPLAARPERAWAERVVARAQADGIRRATTTDASRELREWDVFILPSREDPFPLALLEAMASGVPVVATCVDGIPEQLAHDAGVLVPRDDPTALATAIVDLLHRPERRAALARAARERVERTYSLERQANGLDAAYRSALKGRPR